MECVKLVCARSWASAMCVGLCVYMLCFDA